MQQMYPRTQTPRQKAQYCNPRTWTICTMVFLTTGMYKPRRELTQQTHTVLEKLTIYWMCRLCGWGHKTYQVTGKHIPPRQTIPGLCFGVRKSQPNCTPGIVWYVTNVAIPYPSIVWLWFHMPTHTLCIV